MKARILIAISLLLAMSSVAQAKPYLNDYVGSEVAATCATQTGWGYNGRSAAEQKIPVETVLKDINSKFPDRMTRQVYQWYTMAIASAEGGYKTDMPSKDIYYKLMQECVEAVGVKLSKEKIDEIRGEPLTPYVPYE